MLNKGGGQSLSHQGKHIGFGQKDMNETRQEQTKKMTKCFNENRIIYIIKSGREINQYENGGLAAISGLAEAFNKLVLVFSRVKIRIGSVHQEK